MKIDKSSLFASAFLVLSLITVVGITSNPLKVVAFESYARVSGTANANRAERQALREGGDKWKVLAKDGSTHACKGSECYGIQLGTVQNVATAKQVTAAVLTNDSIQRKACENEGGTYTNSTCYARGVVPPVLPKTSWDANDFAQVAQSNADNSQIATVRALCTLANSADQCKDATFLEKYSLSTLQKMDTSSGQTIYNNALNRFNSNQSYIADQAKTKYTSISANENVVSAETKNNGVLIASQTPNISSPVIETVAVHTNNAYDCRVLGESGNQYYSYHKDSHLCFLNPKSAGASAVAVTQEGTTAQPMTQSQCADIGRTGQVQVSYANGLCTQQPVGSSTPPLQKYLAPTTTGGGYYLSCIQSQCPTGTKTTYSGTCACAVSPPSQVTYTPPAGTSDVVKAYFDSAVGTASVVEKDQAQTDCNNALKITCDSKTLQTFLMTQLKAINPALYQQAISQGVQAPPGEIASTPALPPAPAPVPGNVAAGSYAQRDFANVIIPNTNGHTLANLGCGVIAVTNILNQSGYNYTPEQVLAMIKPEDWDSDGIGGETGGDFLRLLTDAQKYDPNLKVDFKYGIKPANFASFNIWDRMSQGQVLWVGSNEVSGTAGKNIAHITYLVPTSTPDTFMLETNDYFGSNMTCKPGETKKGDGFKCSNDKGDTVEIPIDIDKNWAYKQSKGGQAVYILTPPSK